VILIDGFADLLAVGTPIGWSSIHAFWGVAAVGVVLVGGGWLAERIATSLWFGESVDDRHRKASVSPSMKEDKRPLRRRFAPWRAVHHWSNPARCRMVSV